VEAARDRQDQADGEPGLRKFDGKRFRPLNRLTARTRVEKTAERVAKQILADIIANDMKPGDMLPPEQVMLERYGTGRASLREALWLLEMYGILWVKIGPGGGPVVGDLRTDDFARLTIPFLQVRRATINHLLDARLALEPLMARMAANAISEAGTAELKQALRTGHQTINRPGNEWGDASARFHALIGELSGNVMLSMFNGALTSIFVDRVQTIYSGQARETVHNTHAEICDAIVSGDGATAENLMRDHVTEMIDRVRARIPGLLEEVIEWR
jgi:GntR family transcriptional regulator, transcriptional repressor for pyruvate dehydrogenase complex